MMENGKPAITITGVEVQNFRRLTFARLRVDKARGLVKVTGDNHQGKTSLLEAITATLGGAKLIGPATVHAGADEGRTTVTLSNGFTIDRVYKEGDDKGTLVVRSADGGRYGQTRLNDWLGPLAFDPLSFYSLKPEQQADTLLKLGTDPDLPQKLREIRAHSKRIEEERKPWNAQARTARAVPQPEGQRPEPVDTSAEMQRLEALQAEQAQRESVERQRSDLGELIQKGEKAIAELEAKLAAARAKLAQCHEADAALSAQLETMPDRTDAISAVRSHIADAQVINDQLEPWRAWDRAQDDYAEAVVESEKLTAQLQEYEDRKTQLLVESGIDVPGLSFDDEGEPLLNGRPLSVASGRERIDLAVDVAMRANPQLRICLVDEANDLGLKAMERLDERAQEYGFQVWVVRLGLEGPGEIVVDDGRAWNRDEYESASQEHGAPEPPAAAAVQADTAPAVEAEPLFPAQPVAEADFDLFEIETLPGSDPF